MQFMQNSQQVPPVAGSMPAIDILSAHGLTKVYSNTRNKVAATALNGLDLHIHAGEFVSIMGPSGSGKSTLLNLLAGLDRPSAGSLFLQGQDITQMTADRLALFRRRQLGFVFQDFNLLDTLTLGENIALPLSLDGMKGNTITQRVEEVMRLLGIEAYIKRYPYEVSGGQQQRAAVARAIVHRPALILADEPTGNLDSASARALLALFQRLNRDLQATILMVTHDPLAASYSQRVVCIKDGVVFQSLQRTGDQQRFFQHILNLLAQLEGNNGLE
ncbi:peptide ABC transporter ATP-binding protein [Dictyobacter alpinus]|uniref:Peptide ABC transporter ATP-binding protein n=1 Tax=Dictyobacter alpinus TaxID=2014873 RepID=A0A402B6I9_9CHLR|nr:ABC transporter ATP-binding protein [Dictyobacter alpinus]GCE26964.1 peptide ABC transporter ATP-binding protein [Dictyobacter alpinus]